MVHRECALGAFILGFLFAFAEWIVPEQQLYQGINSADLGWLPELYSYWHSLVAYAALFRGIAFLASVIAVFGLGYWAGSRIELGLEYRRFAVAIAFGSAIGYFIASVIGLHVVLADTGFIRYELETLFLGKTRLEYLAFLGRLIGVGVHFAIVAFAGAALAHLVTDSTKSSLSSAL